MHPSSEQSHLDVQFSVPQTHRLRFTDDCFGRELHTLYDVLEPSGGQPARVQVWIDKGLLAAFDDLDQQLQIRFETSQSVELTSPIQLRAGGEGIKNDPQIIDGMLSAFDRDHLDRRSYVIAIGGGAFLDAVGYATAIAHRGLRLVRFPTTTLAQADSGVGVKNAVNWFGKKNWKGTFATPWAVINDARLLFGQSDRDFRAGFSESVKVALLKDESFFNYLHQNARVIADRSPEESKFAIKQSVLWHLTHITQGGDPFESLQARPLDFGHWSAHKLEAITNYRLRHGEAVSIGVALDTAYSFLTLGLPLQVAERAFETLQSLQLPIWDEALNNDAIFEGLEEFRQHLGGELTITLLEDAGSPVNAHSISDAAMREAIDMVRYYAEAHADIETSTHPSVL